MKVQYRLGKGKNGEIMINNLRELLKVKIVSVMLKTQWMNETNS